MSSDLSTESVPTLLGVPARLRLLQEVQKGSGIHQAEFLRRLDTSKTQWARYLKGEDLPGKKVLRRIAAATGKSVAWIMLGDSPQLVQSRLTAPIVQPTLGDVTPPERAILFPLMRALLDLSRGSEDTFLHLLKQTKLLLRAEQLSLAPIDTAIEEFLRVTSKAPDVHARPPQRGAKRLRAP